MIDYGNSNKTAAAGEGPTAGGGSALFSDLLIDAHLA